MNDHYWFDSSDALNSPSTHAISSMRHWTITRLPISAWFSDIVASSASPVIFRLLVGMLHSEQSHSSGKSNVWWLLVVLHQWPVYRRYAPVNHRSQTPHSHNGWLTKYDCDRAGQKIHTEGWPIVGEMRIECGVCKAHAPDWGGNEANWLWLVGCYPIRDQLRANISL